MLFLKTFAKDRRGSIAVTFSLAATPLMLMAGAAMDYSRAARERHDMQAALDSALLAAALAKPAQRQDIATKVYNARSGKAERVEETLTLSSNDAARTLSGVVHAKVPTTLLKVGGLNSLDVTAQGTVSLDNGPVCMLLKSPTGIGLDMGSSTNISMPGCEVHVYSAASNAVAFSSGAAVDAAELCVKGEITYKSAMEKASYHPKCTPARDEYKLPTMAADPTCRYKNEVYANSPNVVLTEGTICGGMTFKSASTVTFKPGLYRVRGGAISFSASSTVVADGVTFYFEDEKSFFSMNANSKMSITAPTAGLYKGIAMFEAPGLPLSDVSYVSAASASMQGLFYLPSRNLKLNSSTGLTSRRLTIVANTAGLVSSSAINVEPLPDEELRLYDRHITLLN